MLVLEGGEKSLHAWREGLAGVIIKIRQIDLVSIFRRTHLRNVKINGVVIGEVNQKHAESLILENGWQVLEGSHQFGHEHGAELTSGN